MNMLRVWPIICQFGVGAILCIIGIWGGLRGGLAVALALSVPGDTDGSRSLIIAMTYGVVLFSILVQGTTIKPLVRNATDEGS